MYIVGCNGFSVISRRYLYTLDENLFLLVCVPNAFSLSGAFILTLLLEPYNSSSLRQQPQRSCPPRFALRCPLQEIFPDHEVFKTVCFIFLKVERFTFSLSVLSPPRLGLRTRNCRGLRFHRFATWVIPEHSLILL